MISGPIIEPSSENPPKQMIIFVHGYGADGNDLIGLANYFQSTLPEAIFLSPHAPEACSMNPSGYQWFDLTSTDPAVLWSKILVAADHLNEFIDSKLLEYNIAEENLALIGFSQGTILSYALGLNYPERFKKIIGFSGYIDEAMVFTKINNLNYSNLNLYISHGTQDPVIPVDWARKSIKILKEKNINHNYKEFDSGHTISADNFYDFKNWLESTN